MNIFPLQVSGGAAPRLLRGSRVRVPPCYDIPGIRHVPGGYKDTKCHHTLRLSRLDCTFHELKKPNRPSNNHGDAHPSIFITVKQYIHNCATRSERYQVRRGVLNQVPWTKYGAKYLAPLFLTRPFDPINHPLTQQHRVTVQYSTTQ